MNSCSKRVNRDYRKRLRVGEILGKDLSLPMSSRDTEIIIPPLGARFQCYVNCKRWPKWISFDLIGPFE